MTSMRSKLTDSCEDMNNSDDQTTPLGIVKEEIRRFVAERQWGKFHNPKNLAMSVGIEAGELMEVFQWLTPEAASSLSANPELRREAEEELADVMVYCLMLAMSLDVDVTSAILRKIEKNRAKYPVEEFKAKYHRPKRSKTTE